MIDSYQNEKLELDFNAAYVDEIITPPNISTDLLELRTEMQFHLFVDDPNAQIVLSVVNY